MKPIRDYEIVDHGVDYPDYFQGCGTYFTDFEDVATGNGMNAKEAYDDACEWIAQQGYNAESLPKRPRGIRASDRVLARHGDEAYYYVSIRVR